MKKIISLIVLVLSFVACKQDDIQENVFDTTPKQNSLENEIQGVGVLIHEGHLHGSDFHYNPPIEYLKRKYYVFFEKQDNGKWKQVLKGKANEFDLSQGGIPADGGNTTDDFRRNQGNRYAFEITFYNKEGEELNSKIVNEEDYYQVFFTTDNYHQLYDKSKVTPTQNNGKDLINFRYRDTDPINEMYGAYSSTAKLRKKPIGFKGYMGATKYQISYNVNISLFEWNNPNAKGNGLDFYDLPKTGGRTIVDVSIPMDIVYFLTATDKGTQERYEKLAEYFGVTPEEIKKAIENQPDHDNGGYWM